MRGQQGVQQAAQAQGRLRRVRRTDWTVEDKEAVRVREEQQRLADVPGLLYNPAQSTTQLLRQHDQDM